MRCTYIWQLAPRVIRMHDDGVASLRSYPHPAPYMILLSTFEREYGESYDKKMKIASKALSAKLLLVNHSFSRSPILALLAPCSEKLDEELNIA